MTARMDKRFADLRAQNRPALVTYFMGGDPDFETSLGIMKALPDAGADVIELGMPFSDPMADGPAIQMAGQRALKGGQTLATNIFKNILLNASSSSFASYATVLGAAKMEWPAP